MSELTVAERVAKGVEVLDAWDPTWPGMVNLETLDVATTTMCVTAQTAGRFVYGSMGDYEAGTHVLGLDSEYEAADHGFAWLSRPSMDLDPTWHAIKDAEVAALNAEWRRVIADRLA